MQPKYVWFTDEEAEGMDTDLMTMCDIARGRAGIAFVKTCGLRTPDKNAEVGGVTDSAHLPDAQGLSRAMDIACDNSTDRWKMVFALKEAGIRRIVIEQLHIHVDNDPAKPQNVLAILGKP